MRRRVGAFGVRGDGETRAKAATRRRTPDPSNSCGDLISKASSGLTLVNRLFIVRQVIRTFADDETEQFWAGGKSRRLPTEILKRAMMRLLQLDAATIVADLRMPPSNHLEALRGDRSGQWSIRINDQWRVCFRFESGDAFEVEIIDYH